MGKMKKLLKWLLILLVISLFLYLVIFLMDKVLVKLKEKYGDYSTIRFGQKDHTSSYSSTSKESDNTKNNGTDSKSSNEEGSSTGNNSKLNSADTTYSPFNLDDVILLYEGKQNGSNIKVLMQRLIDNTDQTLYSYVTVSPKNVGGLSESIIYTDKDSYCASLQSLIDVLEENTYYRISFGYNNLKTHVNEIIIENI